MDFLYCLNPDVDEPVMLIDRHIGFDEDEGMGIDGAQFQRELLSLDAMSKKRIQVWINSPGGVVMDGYNIYNAILASKTPVDTYCRGMAASIAGVIFQAGRKRIMADYGLLMYHNPYGADDNNQLKAMKASLVTMIASRAGKSEEEVSAMMDKTTWIGPSEALAAGLCDQIEASSEANMKYVTRNVADARAQWKAFDHILNSVFLPTNAKKFSNMKQVCNRLGLNEDAKEANIIAAIEAVENRATTAEAAAAAARAEVDVLNKSKAEIEDKMKALKDEYDKLAAELKDMKDKAEAAEEEVKEEKAKNLVAEHIKAGRIKSDEETRNLWTAKAKADFEGTKNLLESLTVNKTAAKIDAGGSNNADELTNVVARTMVEIRNNLK